MKYPIIAYGDPVLRTKAIAIKPKEYPHIKELVENMFETMYAARGIGLAAPQVGLSIRLFVIDCSIAGDKIPELKDFKKVFINAAILDETGEEWGFNEGCLSIPGIMEEIYRKPIIKLSYYDEEWNPHEETFSGLAARVIQHEYDHIEGKLFTDKLDPLSEPLIEKRLTDISNGIVDVDYEMKFSAAKRDL
jgi:peptide deformylase